MEVAASIQENILMATSDTSPTGVSVANPKRRKLLIATASVVGAAGLVATGIPFYESWWPSERARAAGAPVTVDASKLEPGEQITVPWRGRPIWVLRRTPEMLERMRAEKHLQRLRDPNSEVESQQPAYADNEFRSIHEEHLVVIGICTHLGCVPTFRPEVAPEDLGPDWIGGYFCPCHGSRFDFAGRVFVNVPAPTNLVVPPYHYISETLIEVGVDSTPA
ncbi:MAG: ubiquinol-cytochrome c reductase iron-sulfur subunit [Gammaproteobacteria bacterium]|nr:MAG: ubiquinol-cytochrome c reductase iron-sulfur subunit [Gammaproteobacteria bacterium]